MPTYSTTDFDRIGRIIRLIKRHQQAQTSMALWFSREQYLKYYLQPGDWAFWQAIKADQVPI
ncbi:hypothetical protein [Spirosoma horti]